MIRICFCLYFEIWTLDSSKYHRWDWWTTLKAKLLDLMSKSYQKGKKNHFHITVNYTLQFVLLAFLCQELDFPSSTIVSCTTSSLLSGTYPYILSPQSPIPVSDLERTFCDSTCYLPLFLSPAPDSNSGLDSFKWHIIGHMLLHSLWEKVG